MSLTLRHNLTSDYLDAARRLSPPKKRRRIVAYVESYDDVAFWRTLLSEFETDERYFQVMLPSQTSLSKGKKTVLLNTLNADKLGGSLIACVDSDYDFLMQGATALSRRINQNPYVLQTYAYAIENYLCYAETLHDVCVQATLNDRQLLDFPEFMRRYSRLAYPLFLWNIWFYRRHDNTTFPMYEFNQCVRLQDVSLAHPYRCLDDVRRRVDAKLSELRTRFPQDIEHIDALGEELTQLGLTPDTTYLYIQGHHLMDGVVMKLLNPVCTQLAAPPRAREGDSPPGRPRRAVPQRTDRLREQPGRRPADAEEERRLQGPLPLPVDARGRAADTGNEIKNLAYGTIETY